MQIVSNCPLCEQHSLHIIGQEEAQMLQCLHCGYVSTTKFIGKKEDNEEYQNLTEDMKNWSKEFNDRIWIPTMMTLPIGMLYPFDVEEVVADGTRRTVMKWAFAEMVNIPEEEQKNYPIPGDTEQYYETMYDVDNAKQYDEFFEGMLELNNRMKEEAEQQNQPTNLKLPKLKKVD